MINKNLHWGSTLDSLVSEEGIREATRAEATMRVVAWQFCQEMEKQGITKAKLAELMHTSRGSGSNRTENAVQAHFAPLGSS